MWGKISLSGKYSLKNSLNIGKKSPSREKFPQNFTKYEGKFQFSPIFSLNMGKIFPIYGENFSKISLNMDKIKVFVGKRETDTRFSSSSFFHESVLGLLSIPLGSL
jgi:hypothetical protein